MNISRRIYILVFVCTVLFIGATAKAVAWALIVGVVVTVLVAGAAVLLAPDEECEVSNIDISVASPGIGDWYVGQERTIDVDVEGSFGHIRGDDVGTITLEVAIGGETVYECSRQYTEEEDDDPDPACDSSYCGDGTCTLGRWEGAIPFTFEVEAIDDIANGSLDISVTVDGLKEGWIGDSQDYASKSETMALTILHPLEPEPNSGRIGWLDPATGTILHMNCFEQELQVRNWSTDPGEITQCRISHTTANNVPFEAVDSNSAPRAAVTAVVDGDVGHEGELPGHPVGQTFQTCWTLELEEGENIRLFLDTVGEPWTNVGESGPSNDSNTCDGGLGSCTLLDIIKFATVKAINSDFQLQILSRSQGPRPAGNRDVTVTDKSGFNQTYTTDANGMFTITADPLGPLVTLNLVTGSDSALFVPKNLQDINVSFLDSSHPAFIGTLNIMEAPSPEITVTVIDNFGDDVRADIFAINPDNPDDEVWLRRVTGGPVDLGPYDLSKLGYPSTTIRMRVDLAVNRSYVQDTLDFPSDTTGDEIDLETVIFEESAPFDGTVAFTGTFEVRRLDEVTSDPLPGLVILVEGIPDGEATTDASGHFDLSVPGPAMTRNVFFPNASTLMTPSGNLLEPPPKPFFPVEFGRGGAVLDLGIVTLHETVEGCDTPALCDGDANGDGAVDPLDSGGVLARFGLDPCEEGNCQYDVNCDGSIDPLDSGYVLARFGACNEVPVCKICNEVPPDNVFNDDCSDAPVDSLSIGGTNTYEATNLGATATCAALGALGDTWHAFELSETANVTTDKCGTVPVWGNALIVVDPECPCSGAFIFAEAFDQVTCDDGNWSVHYDALPAGDYWAPEILDPDSGNEGKYLFNISAFKDVPPPPPPECGDPDAGDCCIANGSPGCDDAVCCEAICAADSFCCDIEWDQICADQANDLCEICSPGFQGPGGGKPPIRPAVSESGERGLATSVKR